MSGELRVRPAIRSQQHQHANRSNEMFIQVGTTDNGSDFGSTEGIFCSIHYKRTDVRQRTHLCVQRHCARSLVKRCSYLSEETQRRWNNKRHKKRSVITARNLGLNCDTGFQAKANAFIDKYRLNLRQKRAKTTPRPVKPANVTVWDKMRRNHSWSNCSQRKQPEPKLND
jgi:hypothetical protein